jgi:two-component system, OmpR family, response regulator
MAEADKVVVVVTEDADLREDAVYSFPTGFEVLIADDARHALRIMAERQPSLAIVDIQTGSSGGFNLAREMNQVGNLADVPVLMLIERPQDSWLAGQSGAQKWRTKPVDGADLVREALALLPS